MAKAPIKDDDDKDEDKDAAAAEGAEAEAGEEGGKKFGLKKLLLFVVLPLFILGGAGAGLYFSGMLNKFLKKDEVVAEGGEHAGKEEGGGKKEEHGKAKGEHGEVVAGAAFLEIPNMLVNLSGPDEQPRYLRLKVQLELENQADLEAVQAVMPRVVDQFQTYLRELRIKDLRGSAGIYRLQMELLSRVNAAAYPTEVKDVLFQEILIQ
ncbi:MAG TPA: flagellar basal body-associated FliL family protein [Micavibrio sp.]|jgi:flagellar FliL protein